MVEWTFFKLRKSTDLYLEINIFEKIIGTKGKRKLGLSWL